VTPPPLNKAAIPAKGLAAFLASSHLDRFSGGSVSMLARQYAGVYATRPTSWLAAMARNTELSRDDAIAAETDTDLLRVPGMRRSKFLLPKDLAYTVFAATRKPLSTHEWRLTDAGLTVADYEKHRPALVAMTTKTPLRLRDIGKTLALPPPIVRTLITVACYDGHIVRAAPPNIWSNRWWYQAAPTLLTAPGNSESALRSLAQGYVRQYGPVSVADLAWWAGVSKTVARGLILASDAIEIATDFWLSPEDRENFEKKISGPATIWRDNIRFLPAWDPLSMGYAPGGIQRRALGLDESGGYDTAGNGLPVVLFKGRAITTWRTSLHSKQRTLDFDPAPLDATTNRAIRAAASVWADRIGVKYTNNS